MLYRFFFYYYYLNLLYYSTLLVVDDQVFVQLEVYVDKRTAPLLTNGLEKIEDILVLHLQGGKDLFVSIIYYCYALFYLLLLYVISHISCTTTFYRELNPWPLCVKLDALTTTPARFTFSRWILFYHKVVDIKNSKQKKVVIENTTHKITAASLCCSSKT